MATEAKEAEVRPLLAYRERWRFISSWDAGSTPSERFFDADDAQDDGFEPVFHGSKPEAGVGSNTQYGKELSRKYKEQVDSGQLESKKRRLFGRRLPSEETWIQGPSLPPVPENFMAPQRWTLLVSAAWSRPQEHINIKEARVCLMSLRRICRTTGNLGTTALTLTDNLVSALVFERGRSSSHSLNNLCRRAAAYQIGCRIQWRLRHIPSEMNVSDGPSRRWGPDQPVRRARPSGECQSESGEFLRRRIGLETMAGHFPAHSDEIVKEPSSSSKTRNIPTQTASRPKYFLELFSGSARLTKSMKGQNFRVLPDLEISKGQEFDLLNPHVQQVITSWMKQGRIWMIHLGTPCTVWSRARHNLKNWQKARDKEAKGVACAIFTAVVIRLALALGIKFTLENPQSSRLWKFGPIAQIFSDRRVYFYTFHMCAFGAPHKKGTSVLTNIEELYSLEKRCSGKHKHEQLRGTERVCVDGLVVTRKKTVGAGAYPPLLCSEFAQACRRIAPASALGKTSWHVCNQFLLDLWDAVDTAAGKSSALLPKHDQQHGKEENPNVIFAKQYVKTHPVIFGQHTATDVARIQSWFRKKGQKNHSQAKRLEW